MDLPLDLLRAIAREQPAPGASRALFLAISGAHLYGFASPDSDFDLHGARVAPLRRVVSLVPPRETLQYSGVRDGREVDFASTLPEHTARAGDLDGFHLRLRTSSA